MQKENRKMRKFAVVLLVVGFTHVSAFGGVISFSPSPVDVNVPGGDSPLVTLDVFLGELGSIGNAFGAFDVVFGSGLISAGEVAGLELVSFVWDAPLFALAPVFFPPSIAHDQHVGIYLDDIQIGMFIGVDQSTLAGPVRLGSLTVDTTGLAFGPYQVIVDFGIDNTSLGAGTGGDSFLSGTGFVNVIPEPATITLLGLASLALVRRRRKA